MAIASIDVAALRIEVSFDPETGVFARRVERPRSPAGSRLGAPCSNGYLMFRVMGQRYLAHRLAWLYVYGAWPDGDIDHINGNRADNRIANLREATKSQNMANTRTQANNRSGVRGVIFDKASGKWMAYMQQHGRFINLGRYDIKEDAATARQEAFSRAFGEFAGRGASAYQ